ncbi:AzlC family ABC transporter permease [Nocardia zapadnayensis]|uniref:AzlC family ABC transporter permease n=1 Tax=Nocardia rhamnosiphila TaxID=426716 RepID=UPI002246A31E|nr:AzlC family ABC transporter permease [Nocardia zapadnayensis]MCX0270404.1 AzlC family ABC transporter permease [Nocardia zapadnayensis]
MSSSTQTTTSGTPGPPGRESAPPDLRAALADSGSVGLALFPLGLALGVLVVHSQLAWWWAPVFAGVVYAGSLEFLLIGLVTAATPLAQVALTAFLVNFRHVFYALSFPLHRVRGRWARGYATFALTDEAYALTTGASAREWSGRRILWLQVLCQGYWVAGATIGAGGAALLPVRLDGLDFALTALFVVLAVDGYRTERDIPVPVTALVCALVARLLLPGQMLPVALGLFTAALLIRRSFTSKELTRA